MSVYYITCIKKDTVGSHTYITEVLLHEVVNNSVHQGIATGKGEVIKLIKAKHSIYTAIWNYSNISWSRQEPVSYENRQGQEYLRTTPDNTQKDNLLHLLPMGNLGL